MTERREYDEATKAAVMAVLVLAYAAGWLTAWGMR